MTRSDLIDASVRAVAEDAYARVGFSARQACDHWLRYGKTYGAVSIYVQDIRDHFRRLAISHLPEGAVQCGKAGYLKPNMAFVEDNGRR